MAAIQTFPKNFTINCGRVEAQRQLGNAVPSLLAEVLAREIASTLKKKKYPELPSLSVLRKRRLPPSEPVAAVPNKYLRLVGQHDPHPGTGKGRSYRYSGSNFVKGLLFPEDDN
jgi:DNA (cytosine-5)-methyltransferase 1